MTDEWTNILHAHRGANKLNCVDSIVLGTGTRVPEYRQNLFITRLLSTPQCPYGSEFGAIYNVSD